MCGIIGFSGYIDAEKVVLEGLKELEYRGYDSAGIALQREDSDIPYIVSYAVILPNTSIAGILYTFILPLFGLSLLYKISGMAYFKEKTEIKFEKLINKSKIAKHRQAQ